MINRSLIGQKLPSFSTTVETGRLRLFAKATGQSDPVYTNEEAARAAGHRGLPVPPTFFFCLELDAPDPAAFRNMLGVDYRNLLHGEQSFAYYKMAYAGDRLHFEQRIADIYDKKNGALEFCVRETRVTNERQELVATLRATVVRSATEQ